MLDNLNLADRGEVLRHPFADLNDAAEAHVVSDCGDSTRAEKSR
jgi:hypothetical protein